MSAKAETPAGAGPAAADPAALGPVVLFDGGCNLCHGSVRFVARRDPRGRFRFAALQSEVARRLLERVGAPADLPAAVDSLVLVQDGRWHVRSDAALRIAARLRAPWPLLSALRIVPRPLRDAAYAFVARRRLRWFGRREACLLPAGDLRGRFLDPEALPGPAAGPGAGRSAVPAEAAPGPPPGR